MHEKSTKCKTQKLAEKNGSYGERKERDDSRILGVFEVLSQNT
jgi:hypothetical protein